MVTKANPNMKKKRCESCGGIGQISYFKGVSRFLLSYEECPECAGLGFLFSSEKEENNYSDNSNRKKTNNRQ